MRDGWLGVIGVFVIVAACISFACVVEGPTHPSPTPKQDIGPVSHGLPETGDAQELSGGKSCVLYPAGGSLLRDVCNYNCANGSTFSVPGPLCAIVLPYPKK